MKCPDCQTINPDMARFCMNCGHSLSNQTFESAPLGPTNPAERVLQKYRTNTAELLRTRNESERRIVTILFCDVKGSTAMAEKLDPEEWAEIMNKVFEHLIGPIYRYEGTVVRLLGDAILAFFGAPVAHEDDPQRAVLAGLDIIAAIRDYRHQIKKERGLDFDVRVGINTGLVVVGAIGSDLRAEYTIMGDAVNLAARMEQTAQAGTVQIAVDTHKFIEPLFEFESLGGIEVKGKSKPVSAFRVLCKKEAPGSLRGIDGLNTPLVGREKEMSQLRQILVNLEEQQQGQIICLIGEAGLGKSRLRRELKSEWQQLPTTTPRLWSESQGISYNTTHPYGQFQQRLRSACGATDTDSVEVVSQKMVRFLESVPSQKQMQLARICDILLTLDQDSEAPQLQGEALKRELFETILGTYQAWSAKGPIVMAFEDLHWADPASIELLIHIFQLVAKVPMLFLCVFRPDQAAPSWQVKSVAAEKYAAYYTEVNLKPLSTAESSLLVENLLTISDLPAQIRDIILEKAEGNPFFVEEIVRSFIDNGIVQRDPTGSYWQATSHVTDIAIPDNVHGLLAARIDRLPKAARHTLQLASVIGRTFTYPVLQSVANGTGYLLEQHLSTFEEIGLIRQLRFEPEAEYMFHHILTQEAAYNTVLLKRRREYHRRVGQTLETLYAGRLEDRASLLGHHFHRAEDYDLAKHYYIMAGDLAVRLYANTEASTHYQQALEITKLDLATKDDLAAICMVLTDLYLKHGRSLELVGRYADALANYQEMQTLALKQEYKSMQLAALIALTTIYAIPTAQYEPKKGIALAQQALLLARELDDAPAEAKILWTLCLTNLFGGRATQAVQYGEQSLTIARRLDLQEQAAYTLNDLQRAYMSVGEMGKARQALDEAGQLWRKLDNKSMLADTLGNTVIVNFVVGNYDRAIVASEEGYEISQAIGNRWGQAHNLIIAGLVHFERGDIDKAIAANNKTIELAEQIGFIPPQIGSRASLGWLYASMGQVKQGLELNTLALQIAAEQFPSWQLWPLSMLARLHVLAGNLRAAKAVIKACQQQPGQETVTMGPFFVLLAEIELSLAQKNYSAGLEIADKTLTLIQQNQAIVFKADTLYLKGLMLYRQGQLHEAYDIFSAARSEAETVNARRVLWPILCMLSELEAQQGYASMAGFLQQQAREIINYIADHTGSPELRDSFLDLPQVQLVIESTKNPL